MGSISGEFLLRGLRFNCSGHQCWFASEPIAAGASCNTGHLAAGAASTGVVSWVVMTAPWLLGG